MGVRLALGAQGSEITAWILRQALVLALAGLGIGLAGYLALARFLQNVLYGTSPTDAGTIAVASMILGFITLAASYIPARRAVKIDPAQALRSE